jgi:hypothetical protein
MPLRRPRATAPSSAGTATVTNPKERRSPVPKPGMRVACTMPIIAAGRPAQ